MLCLSRKKGERIVIGDGADRIIIEVALIDHDKVRLAFDAPRHVAIHRSEVYAKLHAGPRAPTDADRQAAVLRSIAQQLESPP